MKRILLLTLLLVSSFGFGQEPVIEWQKSLGGSLTDIAWSIQQTTDGGYILAGESDSSDGDVTGSNGSHDFWVVKIDSAGNITWQKSLGGTESDWAFSIQQTTDGGYIVAGSTESNDGDVTVLNGYRDYWVVKLDLSGNITWQKSFGGSSGDMAFSVQQTTDAGYIVAGGSASNNGDATENYGMGDSWIIKLDSYGNIIWQKSLGGSGVDGAYSVQQTTDEGYILAGISDSNNGHVTGNNGGYDSWIVKLDSSGNITWQKSLGGSGGDWSESVQQTTDEGYIIAGQSSSNNGNVTDNNGGVDCWVVKLDTAGNIIWQKSLGSSGDDEAKSIRQTTDGGYIIAGISDSSIDGDVTGNYGGSDCWTIKLDSSGNITWQKSLGGSEYDDANSIQQTTDGGYIVAGSSYSTDGIGDVTGNHGDRDFWVVKLFTPNISGKVYNDLNENCILETSEIGLEVTTININPGGYVAEVNNTGVWYLDSLPIGTYTATIDTTNLNWTSTCSVSQSFTVSDPQVYTSGPDFGLVIVDDAGLQDITKLTLNIYPNPTTKTFMIASDIVINSAFKIIDAQGREQLSGNMNGKEQTIDISKLSKGVYSVVFDNSELPVLSVIKE